MPRPLTSFQIDRQREELRALIEAGRSAFQGDTPATKAARIARALVDRTYFQQTYLPHYFSAAPASIHLLLVEHDGDELLAAAAPREHAKSTHESIGRPLHGIVRGGGHLIVLVAD